MRKKTKWLLLLVSLVLLALLSYGIWRFTRPIIITDVYNTDTSVSRIIFKNPPLTKRGLVSWWEQNKAMIKQRYDAPKASYDGTFVLVLWDIGDGYEEFNDKKWRTLTQRYDQSCFGDNKMQCLDKSKIIGRIRGGQQGDLTFSLYGELFDVDKNNDIVVRKN